MSFSELLDKKRFQLSDAEKDDNVSLNMAAAAIMFAVIGADDQAASEEMAHLIELLRKRYHLGNEELIEIVSAARRAVHNEYEINNFLLILRDKLNVDERSQLLNDMWELASSDRTIRASESLTIDLFAHQLDLDSESVSKARDIAEQKLELNLS